MNRSVVAALLLTLPACGVTAQTATPRCDGAERLAVIAQTVPTATYVPCLRRLPQGWRATAFEAADGTSRLALLSDRSGGQPVEVLLRASCDVSSASPAPPRVEGVRSYVRLTSLSPRYAGTLYDVFPGGCVSYRFSFDRGPHIPLMEELDAAVGLTSRRDLRLRLREELDVELDP